MVIFIMVEIKSHTIIGKTWYNIVVFRKRDRILFYLKYLTAL